VFRGHVSQAKEVKMLKKALVLALACIGVLSSNVLGYGPKGHKTVGAVADLRLAGKPIAQTIAELLDGLTLAEAALLPDEIKAWDHGPRSRFTMPAHQSIEDQLFAFVQKNKFAASSFPNHHMFHFTDVPVFGNGKYEEGKTGRSDFDVVHMIPFCIKVLKGDISQSNERMITRPVALILLAHLVGDIHQPLHVGAEYFDGTGMPTNPDKVGPSAGDHGGNSLQLVLLKPGTHGEPVSTRNFHTYWDDDTVNTAFDLISDNLRGAGRRSVSEEEVFRRLASVEPAKWQTTAKLPLEQWSIVWANEILPVAREAHDRLEFQNIHVIGTKGSTEKIANGRAIERSGQSEPYHDWSGRTVREQLHKAGWRLAALLEEIFQ
jgi:hypothetical protein